MPPKYKKRVIKRLLYLPFFQWYFFETHHRKYRLKKLLKMQQKTCCSRCEVVQCLTLAARSGDVYAALNPS